MNLSEKNDATENNPKTILGFTEGSKNIEDLLAAASGPASDVLNALTDIPAQIEHLARVNLAKSFIFREADGSFNFDEAAFQKLWEHLSTIDDTNDGDNPEQLD